MMQKVQNKEVFEIKMMDGRKVINRLGFFDKVNENKPYAWYGHIEPIVEIDAGLNELFDVDVEPGAIEMMDEFEILNRLSNFTNLTPLSMVEVSVHTPCGFYFES